MNATTQQRLTPWLGAAVVLMISLFLILLSGWGCGVHWEQPQHLPPLRSVQHPLRLSPPPPLGSYAVVWQRPLFNSDRTAAPINTVAMASVSLAHLQLTGIILTPHLRMALLRRKDDAEHKSGVIEEIRVRKGDVLPDSHWTLTQLKSRSVVFSSSSGSAVLKLPAGAPIDVFPTPSPVHHRPVAASTHQPAIPTGTSHGPMPDGRRHYPRTYRHSRARDRSMALRRRLRLERILRERAARMRARRARRRYGN